MLFFNTVFVAFYLLWNWTEYSALNGMHQVSIQAYFPLTVLFSGTKVGYDILLVSDITLGLVLFLLEILVNLCFIYRLQRTNDPKQNPSQNATLLPEKLVTKS